MDNFSHLNDLKALGKRMEAARESYAGLFKELAERAGLTTDAFLKYFRGEREIGAISLARYAAIVGLTPNTFLMKTPPDSLDSGEFPHFPAAKRSLVVRLLSAVHGIEELMPEAFEALKEDVEMHERLYAKLLRVRGASEGEAENIMSLASEDPAPYGVKNEDADEDLRTNRALRALDEAAQLLPVGVHPEVLAKIGDAVVALKKKSPPQAGAENREAVGAAAGKKAAAVTGVGATSLPRNPSRKPKR